MVVRMWRCPEHGPVASRVIVGRDGVPRCPECGVRMVRHEYGTDGPQGDPRVQRPPRGGQGPL